MKAAPSCLIIGSARDVHVVLICRELEARGWRADVLDIERDPQISVAVQNGVWRAEIGNVPLESYAAVLNRMKWRIDPLLANEEGYYRFFFVKEWTYLLRGLMFAAQAAGVAVVNAPQDDLRGGSKLLQLSLAAASGLHAPDTYIGTNGQHLKTAAEGWSGAISKVFETSYVPAMGDEPAKSIPTVRMSPSDLAAYGDVIGSNPPLIVQSEVTKRVEARVIASRVSEMTYLIHSQDDEMSVTDWRQREVTVKYEVSTLPPTIRDAVRSMLHRLDLQYGVFDFAIDLEGQWVFFECNPDGQWWAARQTAGGRPESVVVDAIVGLATRGPPAESGHPVGDGRRMEAAS